MVKALVYTVENELIMGDLGDDENKRKGMAS